MNYINKGKRDILIFPNFDNIEEIEKIREKEESNILFEIDLYKKIDIN